MSRVRSLAHLGVTAGALVLASALAVAAFPMLGPPAGGRTALPRARGARSGARSPTKIVHVNPVYPKDAKEDGVQGIYLIAVKIDKEGRIADARVIVSTPVVRAGPARQPDGRGRARPRPCRATSVSAQAALEAVRQWRYEPLLDENGSRRR